MVTAYRGMMISESGNLTVRYMEIEGAGADGNPASANDLIYASLPVDNITFQYCYFHDAGRTHILSRGGSNWLVEYCIFYRNESHADEHSESWSPGTTSQVVVRYNIYEEADGTGVLATLDNDPGPDDWEIYGNLFLNCVPSGGIITTDAASSWTNVKVYNNTIAGTINAGIHIDLGDATGWQVYNNIWYDCTGVTFLADESTLDHDYNWFYPATGTGGDAGEANGQVGTGDPFVNLAGGDLRLSAATTAGSDTGASVAGNDTDPTGATRGTDGTWDRGAYEYEVGGGATNSKLKSRTSLTINQSMGL